MILARILPYTCEIATCGIALLLAAFVVADDKPSTPLEQQKLELGKVQAVVGAWKGVGLPQRGSTKGSWTEESEWKWQFEKGIAELVFTTSKGKYFSGGELSYAGGDKPFVLTATSGDQKLTYRGAMNADGSLALNLDKPADDHPARVTFRLVAGNDRMIMLLEKKSGEAYSRIAEIGATRKGSGFGKGATYIECIVTGGLGTIEVSYEGKTYHVCCTGCLEVFKDDPAGTVKEYLVRKEEEKANKAGK
jgi:hypothetical protein